MIIGRDGEIAKVRALLGRGVSIVTLCGPPGIGKTAIAREVAAVEEEIVFCDVIAARTYEEVCFILAGALDVSLGGGGDLGGVLGAACKARSALVWIDGAEGAVEGVARLAVEIGTRVLVTSRELLRVEGEVAVSIDPLDEASAIAVFVRAAQRVQPKLDAQKHSMAIEELARLLSGVPLALELAASRLSVMDPTALVTRTRETLDWLTTQKRGVPERQASLRGAFESSFAMLGDHERRALLQSTVFRGDFSLEDAEHVIDLSACHRGEAEEQISAIADALQSLVEKSLMRSEIHEGAGVRFALLEIVRRLTLEREHDNDERAAIEIARDRHAEHFAAIGSTWDKTSFYGGVSELPRLRAMFGDLLAAHAHASDKETPDALRAVISLYPIFAAQGPYSAFLELLDEARAERIAAADPALASRFFLVRARGLQLCAMREEAALALEKSLQYARNARRADLAARALAYLALARRTQGSLVEARERFEASAALFREAGDEKSESVVLSGLASLDLGEGDLDGARRALEAAIDKQIASGDPATAAMMRVDLGIVLQESGDLDAARGVYEAALAVHRSAGNRRHEGITLGYLATLEDESDRIDAAEVAFTEALAILRTVGDAKFIAVFAAALAAVKARRDDGAGARAALEEAERAARDGEQRIIAAVALHRLRVEVVAGKDPTAVIARRGAAIGLIQQSDDVRFAARMLDRLIVPQVAPSEGRSRALVVEAGCMWIELPGGKRIDLKRRTVHRRLALQLVRARLASPSEPVALAELVAAGWPAEKLTEASAQNRLHVALAALRADGLRDFLKREPGGYLLDPSTEVRVER